MDRAADALPVNGFIRSVKRAGRLAQEFKARQRLSSASGQLGYLVETVDAWDLTETLIDNPGSPIYQFLITYTGDGTQEFPVVFPYLDLRINGTSDSHKLDYLTGYFGTLLWKSGALVVQMVGGMRPRPAYFEDPFVQQWQVFIQCTGTITYYAKAQAMSSSGGTIEIVRVP